MAKLLGISQGYYSQLEMGAVPSPELAERARTVFERENAYELFPQLLPQKAVPETTIDPTTHASLPQTRDGLKLLNEVLPNALTTPEDIEPSAPHTVFAHERIEIKAPLSYVMPLMVPLYFLEGQGAKAPTDSGDYLDLLQQQDPTPIIREAEDAESPSGKKKKGKAPDVNLGFEVEKEISRTFWLACGAPKDRFFVTCSLRIVDDAFPIVLACSVSRRDEDYGTVWILDWSSLPPTVKHGELIGSLLNSYRGTTEIFDLGDRVLVSYSAAVQYNESFFKSTAARVVAELAKTALTRQTWVFLAAAKTGAEALYARQGGTS